MLFSCVPDQNLRDSRGSVTVITAFAALVLLICAGVAIDYLMLLRAKTELQAALDAATLAAAGSESPVERIAPPQLAFNAHVPITKITASAFSRRSDGTVDGTVTAEMPASFLRVAGFKRYTIRVSSSARAVKAPVTTVLTLKTLSGSSPYDKDLIAVIRDKTGKVVRETMVQQYNYEVSCTCAGAVVTFTPPKETSVTVTVEPGETISYKMIVYRDPNKRGIHWRPDTLYSDDAVRSPGFLKLSGQCSAMGGQTQSWEDGLATTYTSLVVNITCTEVPTAKSRVALVR